MAATTFGMPSRPPPNVPTLPPQPAVQSINIAALSTLPKPRRRDPEVAEHQVTPQRLRPTSRQVSVADFEYHLLPHLHSTRTITGWRLNLASKMQTRFVQILLMILLLGDVIIVVAGLVLEGFESICVGTDISCESSDTDCPVKFEKVLRTNTQQTVEGLKLASLTILCLFGLELLLLLTALGCRFFTNLFYIMDVAVVAVAIWAELTAYNHHEPEIYAIPLLVLLRVWRFARIFHGVGAVHDREERRIQELEGTVAKQKGRIESLERVRTDRKRAETKGAVHVHDQRSHPYEDSDDSALLGDHI